MLLLVKDNARPAHSIARLLHQGILPIVPGTSRLDWIAGAMTTSLPKTSYEKSPASSALTSYKRNYCKRDRPDVYMEVFQLVQATFWEGRQPSVLYPGCHRHLSASLIWSKVDYVDCDTKVANVYDDAACLQWVQQWADYGPEDTPVYSFTCADFSSSLPFEHGSYDMLISLSAGIVSTPCVPYLIPGTGLLVVNDSHSDARTAFLNDRLLLVGAILVRPPPPQGQDAEEQEEQQAPLVVTSPTQLQRYFRSTKDGSPLTHAMVEESIRIGSVAKRSFRLTDEKDVLVYIFRRKGKNDEEHDREADPVSNKRAGETSRSNKRSKCS